MINWSKATTLDPVESGTYEARVIQLKFVPQTSSGNPGLRFDFTLTEPTVEGKRAFSTKSPTPEALWSCKEWLIKLGVDGSDLEQDMSLAQLKVAVAEWNSIVVGTDVRVVLSIYNRADGSPSNSVDRLLTQFDVS